MRLIACLSWYDENPAWLTELVAGLARAGVDHVVAIDGAYALYPQARGNSGSEQAQVVLASAVGCGMGVTVHLPPHPWVGNEIEKRTALFVLAHAVAEPGADWLWVCDADEVITTAAGLRDQLEATDLDVASVLLCEGICQGEHEWSTMPIRKLFRAHPQGIRVERHHARYVTGDDDVLWDASNPIVEAEALQAWDVKVRHRPGDREAYRTRKRLAYYQVRQNVQAEAA